MKYIMGVDEVGMGANAGPVFVCAVKAPIDWTIDGLGDSKKLSPEVREDLVIKLLEDKDIEFCLAERTNEEVDERRLAACHKEGVAEVIDKLHEGYEKVIVDGNLNPILFKNNGMKTDLSFITSVIKADSKYPTVMAASIIAKEHRDALMREYHKDFPYYGWDVNAGYPVPEHKEGIRKYGLCKLHRKTYKIKL